MKTKVVIVGCGNVGMSYAYALLNQKSLVTDLVLVDINKEKTEGEAMDLAHGMPYAPTKMEISAGDYSDCADANIVVIGAGANQRPGETRLELIKRNYEVFKDVIPKIMDSGFNGIMMVVTNPVDAMSYFAYRLSGLPANKVIGTGTSLDTSRLRYLISEKLDVSTVNIHAYVLGEHGDSEFVPWTHARVGLQSIYNYLNQDELDEIYNKVKTAAYDIINKKGVTNYGIGMCMARLTNAILSEENAILCVSTYNKEDRIYISMPCIINQNGVREVISFPLTSNEQEKFINSKNIIKSSIEQVE